MKPDPESKAAKATSDAEKAARTLSNRLYAEIMSEARSNSYTSEVTEADIIFAYQVIRDRDTRRIPDEAFYIETTRNKMRNQRSAWLLVAVSAVLAFTTITLFLLESGLLDVGFFISASLAAALMSSVAATLAVSIRLLDSKRRADLVSGRPRRRDSRAKIDPIRTSRRTSVNSMHAGPNPIRLYERENFITSWLSLEKTLRRLALEETEGTGKLSNRLPNGEILRTLSESGIIDQTSDSEIRHILAMRNSIVHGGDVAARDVRDGSIVISRLMTELEGKRHS